MVYKLLMVDDEPMIRAGLRNHFDWAAYGIEIVGEAKYWSSSRSTL